MADDDHEPSEPEDGDALEEGETEHFDLAAPIDDLPQGASVGRFVVLSRIAEGGMGVVYAAFDPQLDRKVAIKLVRVHEEDPDEAAARRDELVARAQSAAKISHRSVVRIHDVQTFEGGVLVAMEFVDGINLRQWMEARDEPFPWSQVLRVFHEAGRGLAAAHAAGVAHRDFKPDNVLLAKEGRICVLDFGLAREVPEEEEPDVDLSELRDQVPNLLSTKDEKLPELTEGGTITGTPAYMAPEQHVGVPGDARSDQFSFCVAFYEALYGERPFAGNRRATLATEVINNRVRSAPKGSHVPAWLRAVLMRGMSPRRSDRYPSMEALLRDLDHDPAARRRRWLKGLAVIGGLCALGGAVAYLLYFESARCETNPTLVEGVWDEPARATIEEAFVTNGRASAVANWNVVQTRLDDWMNEWLELRVRACRATRVRRDASEELLQARYACLDSRLDEMAAFGRVYSAATPEMIDRAPYVIDRIEAPRDCVWPETLETHAVIPASHAEQIRELRADHNDAWIALQAGNVTFARAKAEGVHEGLERVEYPPLRVRNTLLLGLLAAERGQVEVAEDLIHQAAAMASAVGLQQLAAQAWLEAAELLESDPSRRTDAQTWVEYAAKTVERLADDRLRARLLEIRGDLARAAGKPGDALSMHHRALELLERDGEPSPLRTAAVLMKLGQLVADREEYSAAQRYFQRALDLRQRQLGPEHPALVDPLRGLADAYLHQDMHDEAMTNLERAVGIERKREADPSRFATLLVELAELEAARERVAAALTHLREAAELLRAAESPDAALLAQVLHRSGAAHLQLGKAAEARTFLEEALQLREEAGSSRLALAQTQEVLAAALWEDPGSRKRAVDLAARAREAYASAGKSERPQVDRLDAWLDSHR